MKVIRITGSGLLTAAAVMLLAPPATAQSSPYGTPNPGTSPVYGPPSGAPTAQPGVGYTVPQGFGTRVPATYRMAARQPAAPTQHAPGTLPPPVATSPAYSNAPCATNAATVYGGDVGYNTWGCGYGAGGGLQGCNDQCGVGYGAACGRSAWFGGVYGLLMERDRGPNNPLAFAVTDGSLAAGDYPASDAIVLDNRNVDIGFQGGFEARVGRWLGGGNNCCGLRWGLEGVYWGLYDGDATASFSDTAALRVYSMIDPRGLEYDPGTGWRPVRHYWDYAPPVDDHTNGGALDDVIVTQVRVRSTFEVHNVEVNLLRVGCGGGCGGPGIFAGRGIGGRLNGSGFGGCDASCTADGCCDAGCCGGCGPRFSCTGVCGFRYMQFDETFMYGVNFQNTNTLATGFVDYHAEVENDLYGFQLGCRGLYRLGCAGKWGFHLTSNVGVYGNDIEVRQFMDSPTGDLRFIESGENFDVTASKTDVSMIGEIRAGLSYQYSCNCRLYGGWRAIGVTGIALANDQAPSAFIDAAQLAGNINSNGSLILHGLQTGVEWNY